ncbi:unnamed protein product [Pleuronectes platessa]|uniref:Uncharacterized protein n=1 Tax=Pleuronectes platessa TaxID=8262 RepID=A0A9N7YXC9_PLEPL|nr:unnamed protein product [Pleuronectes platessa]
MDNSDEPEDLLDGEIVFQKNKDRTFSKTKVICTLCEKTLSFHRSNTRLTTATRSMCWSARGVQVECAKPDSLAGHIVQKKRRSLHGFVPVTPEAEAPRCAKAASRCFSLRCDRHKVLTWEWMGASCFLRLGAALKRPV